MAIYWFASPGSVKGGTSFKYTIWALLKNVSEKSITVVTSGVTGQEVKAPSLEFNFFILEPLPGILLKSNAQDVRPVVLEPGETTALGLSYFFDAANRDLDALTVKYYVDDDFRKFIPNAWIGNLEVKIPRPLSKR
jgi:hypothetical protein